MVNVERQREGGREGGMEMWWSVRVNVGKEKDGDVMECEGQRGKEKQGGRCGGE